MEGGTKAHSQSAMSAKNASSSCSSTRCRHCAYQHDLFLLPRSPRINTGVIDPAACIPIGPNYPQTLVHVFAPQSTLTRARLINLEWRPPWPMRPESLCCRPIRVQDVHICSKDYSSTLMVRQRDGLYICVAVLRRWPQTSTARQSMRNMSLTQGTTYFVTTRR